MSDFLAQLSGLVVVTNDELRDGLCVVVAAGHERNITGRDEVQVNAATRPRLLAQFGEQAMWREPRPPSPGALFRGGGVMISPHIEARDDFLLIRAGLLWGLSVRF